MEFTLKRFIYQNAKHTRLSEARHFCPKEAVLPGLYIIIFAIVNRASIFSQTADATRNRSPVSIRNQIVQKWSLITLGQFWRISWRFVFSRTLKRREGLFLSRLWRSHTWKPRDQQSIVHPRRCSLTPFCSKNKNSLPNPKKITDFTSVPLSDYGGDIV